MEEETVEVDNNIRANEGAGVSRRRSREAKKCDGLKMKTFTSCVVYCIYVCGVREGGEKANL